MPDAKHFYDYLSPNNLLCRVTAKSRDELLDIMLATLKRHHPELPVESARTGLLARESETPTVIAPGLALPHARLPELSEPLVGMACLPGGVDFHSELGPVKVVVLVLSPLDNPGMHMRLLAALAGDLGAPGIIDTVAAQKTPLEIIRLLSGNGGELPSLLKAADVMSHQVPTILESDTLEQAIIKFSAVNSPELVVLDRDGDLRGVLALEDLLKLSLPEHLLWMEDLTPINQFQPFAEMLKSAHDTKVADVMREEFVRVDREVPAIQLAKLFIVNKVRQLIITGANGRLAGVVEFRSFCAKLFWE